MKANEFEKGWKHFCDCINFSASTLDAKAIAFMTFAPTACKEALAAGPDMYEALERIRKFRHANESGNIDPDTATDYWDDVMNQAEAALAKAKGEQENDCNMP